jgi:hypothetical protein
MIWIAVIGLVGWAVAGFAIGMWRGERRARIFIENFQVYGQGNPLQKAVSWDDPTPEGRIEEEITKLESVMGTRVTRSGPEGNGKIEYDEETLENGIEYLLKAAEEDGVPLTKKQARDEVERMLNAEGPDML